MSIVKKHRNREFKLRFKKAYIFEITPTDLGRFAYAASSHTVDCFFPLAFVL